ncbi:hypothetical protein [Maricaulis sp.]|uniref:hypothetical protein n=1 Tax=Maricaulis sp. TaxID=1486257 RepID=UPI001B052659|nr:hypothetical protein [Maricaulis sp.]MBO6797763.1 hypothetical protein [Maricaulis sp.]
MQRYLVVITAVLAVFLSASQASGQVRGEAGEDSLSYRFSGTRIFFDASPELFSFTVSVTGPNEYVGQVYSQRRPPSFRLGDHGDVADGLYQFEISAASRQTSRSVSAAVMRSNGRDGSSQQAYDGAQASGSFRVVNGQILVLDELESETER